VTDLQRIVLRGADNHVVNQVDADDPRRVAQLPRQLNILRTGRGVPARMVVLCGQPNYVQRGGESPSATEEKRLSISAHS
jgi:hypothetical protein